MDESGSVHFFNSSYGRLMLCKVYETVVFAYHDLLDLSELAKLSSQIAFARLPFQGGNMDLSKGHWVTISFVLCFTWATFASSATSRSAARRASSWRASTPTIRSATAFLVTVIILRG